jgi:Helix-turn-helix domain
LSYKHINWIRDHSASVGPVKAIEFAIASRANDEGVCWIKRELIAKDAGLSVRAVQRLLKKLPTEGFGLIIVQKGGADKGGKRYSTVYKINIPTGDSQSPIERQTGDTLSLVQSATGDKYASGPETNVSTTGDKCVNDRRQPVSLTKRTKLNKKANSKRLAFLSDDYFAEASKRLHRSERQLRELVPGARRKCAELYPDGGSMGQPFFEEFVKREPMPTEIDHDYKECKAAEAAEAEKNRLNHPSPDKVINLEVDSEVYREFKQRLNQHMIP